LPDSVVDASSVDSITTPLDEHWMLYALYNFELSKQNFTWLERKMNLGFTRLFWSMNCLNLTRAQRCIYTCVGVDLYATLCYVMLC